ncbi:hypothetical protein A5625_11060 [Mycobacterium sp. 1465703.0]|nr:hypothetical protein A5625_11060 [Mycobacterium sp. 1465703.0]
MNAPSEVVELMRSGATEPFVGLTTGGEALRDLYLATNEPDSTTDAIVGAVKQFLDLVDQLDYRQYVQQPFDSWHRRSWFNAAPVYMPAGVLLDDMRAEQQEAALAIVKHCLSPSGYDLVRNCMRINDALGGILNIYTDTFREWSLWFTIFGEPSSNEPWGWQIMGTHIDINCTIAGGTVILEPLFLGAEIRDIKSGPYQGLSLFHAEGDAALKLGRTLTGKQRQRAILFPSMNSKDLPPELGGPIDGRHIGGAGRDNRVVPYEGLSASELSTEQLGLLVELINVYLERFPPRRKQQRWEEIQAHLDEIHIAWIGDPERLPFYYRVHGPTIWIEYDHHPALMLDSPLEKPLLDHVHTIMRAPNGGDYGMALIGRPTA